ncbi:hypothetical protein E2C01_083885 [Portunus trituberculatus]|uniref:Uncharacterized protein n=1 Tax=Portunus trituberculatus TaxID=210409 RepID=A0A5B7J7R6_PORTR|nr:hypothetical protein [Portunus trituberculatus]
MKQISLSNNTIKNRIAEISEDIKENVVSVVQWNHACFGVRAHGFESCPWSECNLGFLTLSKDFLAGGF